MNSSNPLIRVADAYAKALGLSDKTVSSRVFRDSKKLGAMRDGADITMGRFAEAMQWFSDHWPTIDAEWPDDVARPHQREDAE